MKQQVKERPILFSGPMVQAILEGKKTQTRRIVRGVEEPEPGVFRIQSGPCGSRVGNAAAMRQAIPAYLSCPYGGHSDRLWVREAFTYIRGNGVRVWYREDGEPRGRDGAILSTRAGERRWMPSIHMPRSASRITLEVTSVRVERLQEISEDDATAEGLTRENVPPLLKASAPRKVWPIARDMRELFALGWDAINGARASWQANPWVWVVSFKRSEQKESRTNG